MSRLFCSAVVLLGLVLEVTMAPSIAPDLVRTLNSNKKANILISMRHSISPILKAAINSRYVSRSDRLNDITSRLKTFASESQRTALGVIEKGALTGSFSYKSLWITNQIIVRGADLSLVSKLDKLEDVTEITQEFQIALDEPIFGERTDTSGRSKPLGSNEDEEMQWGIAEIEAPRVWATGNQGEGVVVATVDTGVLITHEALKDSYIGGEYGWYDPGESTPEPNDINGHGTHTTGTIAGTVKNIGVAPKVKWAACKGCASWSCAQFDLLECGQWVACPTKPDGSDADCAKAPHIVSNSWSSVPGADWYQGVVDVYSALGIIAFFSIGNSGAACSSARSPGDYENAIGVGATDEKNRISYLSASGPAVIGGRIKPDISAPGEYVMSADIRSDTSYVERSGTSMACPHAAGVAALMLAENPGLDFDAVKDALQRGCVPTNSTGRSCGGISDEVYPNNAAGYGRINAFSAVSSVKIL